MKAFNSPLHELKEFAQIKDSLKQNKGVVEVTGCIDSQKSHLMSALAEDFKHRLIVTYSEQKAKEIYEDYRLFDPQVLFYPAKDLIFYNADIKGNLLVKQRIAVIRALLEEESCTVVTSVGGGMDHLLPIDQLAAVVRQINADSQIDTDKLAKELTALGYERCLQVEGEGQFAIRGGIIDIFPLTEENPFRIELWDDQVDSIRSFDVKSQRSIENLEEITIYPATEMVFTQPRIERGLKTIKKEAEEFSTQLLEQGRPEGADHVRMMAADLEARLKSAPHSASLDSFIHYFADQTVSFLDYFKGQEAVIFLDEANRIVETARAVELEFRESMMNRLEKGYILPGQAKVLFAKKETIARLNRCNCLGVSSLEPKADEWKVNEKYSVSVRSVNSYNGSFELLVKDLQMWQKNKYRVMLLSSSRTRAKRLAEDLAEQGLNSFYTEDLDREPGSQEIMVVHGHGHKGYEYPLIKFVIIFESDIFGKDKKKKRRRKKYEGDKINNFSDLEPGDYVVHENHGLGIYKGMEKIEVDRTTKDYIKIEYAGGGNLYILATQLDMIQKYSVSDHKSVKLNKLGAQEWHKTKSKVKKAVEEIARDLVDLYAVRQMKNGFVYGPDTVWQNEFEEMFPYEETEDQLLAIESVKRDMESTKIMDRLLCGDVGYGKTEVAIRAAFKAVQEGKQVVYLVPTTILAQQHYNTFVQRMKEFPVRVELMSRFRTPAEQTRTARDLRKGLVDIVIGTHRVLSGDVQFKDLGLLIIDEEQRFGVRHKEVIKKMKENVDVLTLTATPIPRTLHMSLIGIRDMSVLEEPPSDRLPIQTYVMEFNEEMVREAINRELARDGQVYYVFNRIQGIEDIAATIQNLVPDAAVAYAHGQMREHKLEKIMYEFINGEIDVLISTTIIETGLDISNVNTMIIHDADTMGLSQLYQLRGRVGRSNRTAYAFLMYQRNKMLKEVAEKRLHAIREFTELGSGFKIAMRDLEIRGAGTLLGSSQSGHMQSVGYDLYCKMLNQAVKQFKGIPVAENYETTIDVQVDAFIPDKYIKNSIQKLEIYKRIAAIENETECDDMLNELIDRFGDLPKSVENLLYVANLKALAHRCYVTEVTGKPRAIEIVMFERARVQADKIPELVEKYQGRLKFAVDTKPYFTYLRKAKEDVLPIIKNILNDLIQLIEV